MMIFVILREIFVIIVTIFIIMLGSCDDDFLMQDLSYMQWAKM